MVDRLRVLKLSALAVLIYGVSATTLAAEAYGAKPGERTVALFSWGQDRTLDGVVERIHRTLQAEARSLPSVRLIHGSTLAKAIKAPPRKAILRCGSNLKCIAKLGKRAGVDTVLYARVMVQKRLAVGQFLRVSTKTATIEHKALFRFARRKEIDIKLKKDRYALFGVPNAGTLVVNGASEAVFINGKKAGPGDGSFSLPSGIHEVRVGNVIEHVSIKVGATETLDIMPEAPAAPPAPKAPKEEVAAKPTPTPKAPGKTQGKPRASGEPTLALPKKVAAAPALEAVPIPLTPDVEPEGGGLSGYGISGIVAASLGLSAVAVGGYFGWQASQRDPLSAPNQIEAQAVDQARATDVERANLSFVGGGAALGLAAALFVVELLIDDERVETSANVGHANTHLELSVHW